MIPIKSKKEISVMAENGKKLAEIMERLKKETKAGIETEELDKLAQELILKWGAKPSFKDYNGFPAALCTSINEEIVHGLPSKRKIKQGDIVSLDLGLYKNGFHSDMAFTLCIGEVDREAKRLIRVTKKVLKLAVKKSRPGNTFGDVGNLIERYSKGRGFNVIRDLCGHGIGQKLHEEPQIMNYGQRQKGEKIKSGMVFCLEPMLSMGGWHIQKTEDGQGYRTKDNSLSAHFEHMIAVTKEGPKVLTKT